MTVVSETIFNGIKIQCILGSDIPRMENGVLKVYGYYNDYGTYLSRQIYISIKK